MSDAPELILAAPALVSELWGSIEPFIERAIPRAHGRMKSQDVLERAAEGAFDVWLIVARPAGIIGVGVAQIVQFPQKATYSVFLYSGNRRQVMHLWPRMEERARRLGCAEVQIAGPRAWGRIFPEFKEAFTVYTKEV